MAACASARAPSSPSRLARRSSDVSCGSPPATSASEKAAAAAAAARTATVTWDHCRGVTGRNRRSSHALARHAATTRSATRRHSGARATVTWDYCRGATGRQPSILSPHRATTRRHAPLRDVRRHARVDPHPRPLTRWHVVTTRSRATVAWDCCRGATGRDRRSAPPSPHATRRHDPLRDTPPRPAPRRASSRTSAHLGEQRGRRGGDVVRAQPERRDARRRLFGERGRERVRAEPSDAWRHAQSVGQSRANTRLMTLAVRSRGTRQTRTLDDSDRTRLDRRWTSTRPTGHWTDVKPTAESNTSVWRGGGSESDMWCAARGRARWTAARAVPAELERREARADAEREVLREVARADRPDRVAAHRRDVAEAPQVDLEVRVVALAPRLARRRVRAHAQREQR